MLFDTHAHVDRKNLKNTFLDLQNEYKKDGLTHVVLPSVEYSSWKDVVKMSREIKMVYGAIGIHPNDVKGLDLKILKEMKEYLTYKKIVAVGEIGLDYYRSTNKEEQKIWFNKQLEVAREFDLPVIIHDREANKDVFDILNKNNNYKSGVIMHCYSGSVEMAKEYVKRGAYISFAGPITFKNARVPKEVAKAIPLEYILIETDSPWLTPEPFRGKKNHPGNVRFVAKEIANLRGMTYSDLAKQTKKNAMKVFRIND